MKQSKIKKLVIELSGKDVELTMAQAKELHAALNELFDEKVVERNRYVPYPVPEPYPVYPRPWRPWRHEPWITWSGTSPLYTSTSGTSFALQNGSIRCQLTS